MRVSSPIGVIVIAGALAVVSACGGTSAGSGSTPQAAAKIVPVAGCENAAFQTAFDAAKGPARCEPNSPAPAPLKEKATVTIAVPSEKIGTVLPLVMAQAYGEFEKENLTVDITVMPSTDAVQLVASGKIDGMAGSTSVGLFNAVKQGFGIKQILGDGWLGADSKMGVWKRADVPNAQLAGKKIGSAIGVGSSVNAPLKAVLAKDGLKLTDLKWEVVEAAEAATALRNGAVDAAVVLDPFWLQLKDDSRFEFVSPAIEPGTNVGGVHAGPKLLDRRDVAVAFARAYVRTTNTYFRDGAWQDNAELMGKMSERLKTPVEKLSAVPGQVYNWDIPQGSATKLQELYIEAKTLKADAPMPENQFVDRSFVAQAVGKERP